MISFLNQQFGLGAAKATSGAVVAATVTQVPGLDKILDAIATLLSMWLSSAFMAAGLAEPLDSVGFWKWVLVAGITYATVFFMRNRQVTPAAPNSASGA